MGYRVRTRGVITPLQGASRSETYVSPLPASSWSAWGPLGLGDLPGNGELQETRDYTTPDFQKRSRNGEIFNNAFYSLRRTAVWSLGSGCSSSLKTGKPYSVGTIKSSEWTGARATYMSAARIAAPPAWDLDTAKTLAGTAAHAGIVEPSVMGMVDLMEMGKTVRMITKDVRALNQFFTIADRDFRRKFGRWPSIKESADFLAQNWLKYRYGYTPLIYSIDGLWKALRAERKLKRLTSRGKSAAASHDVTDVRTSNVPVGTAGFNYSSTLQRRVMRHVSCGVLYEVHTELSSDLGFSFQEIPAAAYELTKMSFVLDWFVNLGDWIRAVTPKSGVRILSEWTTVVSVTEFNGSNTVTPMNATADNYSYAGGGVTFSGTTRILEKLRTPGTSIGLAPKLQEINFEKSKDFKHLADAIALLVGRLKGSDLRI